jgi:predicted DNA-binding transcriptional regulator YafY
MRRADRLFQIIERLRRRRVVTARELAERLRVSERTIYRDVSDLIHSKVPIEGAAGLGYALRQGYDLPPLMFTEEELNAIVFGARIVRTWSDEELSKAADAALAKIEGVLPAHLQTLLEDRSLWAPSDVPRTDPKAVIMFDLSRLRGAIRSRRKIRFRYRDEKGAKTRRKVRPLTLWFYPPLWLAGAWCELRKDFRCFRLDRMSDVAFLDETFPAEGGKSVEDLFRSFLGKA